MTTLTLPKLSEHDLQASIIAEADYRANQDPRWRFLAAVPNGQYRPGQRMEPGLRRGVPDLIWPIKAHGYVGLAMELKVGKNNTSPDQDEWLTWLSSQGWYARVVRDSADAAMALLTWYLSGAK